jgi:uncharacterized protein (DUF1697 family)
VFTSDRPAFELQRHIGAALAEHAGLRCAVMVRTGAELRTVVAANPLGCELEKPSRFFVSFLAAEPDPAAVAARSSRSNSAWPAQRATGTP